MRMEGEGYTGDYTWGQTDQDILIVIPVGEELRCPSSISTIRSEDPV